MTLPIKKKQQFVSRNPPDGKGDEKRLFEKSG
jgi:hypothetical protein